jgi:hypothetical protein
MSIMSSVCADRDLEVVRKAIKKAKAKAKTDEAKVLLQEVLEECEENICE